MGKNSEKRENSEKLRAAHFDEGCARHDRSAFFISFGSCLGSVEWLADSTISSSAFSLIMLSWS